MKKIVTMAVVIVFIKLYMSTNAFGYNNEIINQCGINSLYLSMKYLGAHVSLDQMYSDIRTNSNNEVNLLQLAMYARRYKITVTPVKNPTQDKIKNQLTNESCAILQYNYNKESHIVTLLSNRNKLFCIDPPRKNFILSDSQLDDFCSKSKGMLILSTVPQKDSVAFKKSSAMFEGICIFVIVLGGVVATITALTYIKRWYKL